jgi:hypothetical protein
VETAGNPLQGVEIGVEDDVWFLPADRGGGAVVQPVAGQVLQGVVASLPGAAGVVVARWRVVGAESCEGRFPCCGGEGSIDPEHSLDPRGGETPADLLGFGVEVSGWACQDLCVRWGFMWLVGFALGR